MHHQLKNLDKQELIADVKTFGFGGLVERLWPKINEVRFARTVIERSGVIGEGDDKKGGRTPLWYTSKKG